MNLKKAEGQVKGIKRTLNINLEDIVYKNIDIDDTDLDGEKVMMNLNKGQYFMMNEVGSRIWQIIDNRISIKDIVNKLCCEYDVDEKTCNQTVIEFLKKLIKSDLIRVY